MRFKLSRTIMVMFSSLCMIAAAYSQLSAGEGKKLSAGIDEMVRAMTKPEIAGKGLRVAVLPLAPTSSADKGARDFGKYFADIFTSKLKESGNNIRVFERDRLTVVTDELELNRTGMIDSESAKKIGQLAPVDVIFTGSYTVVKPDVEISGKLIHVVSGEIVAAVAVKVFIDESLEDFFYVRPVAEKDSSGKKTGSPCDTAYNEFSALLKDVSAEEKVRKIVLKACAYPVFDECVTVHPLVTGTFQSYKIQNKEYHDYLVQGLQKVSHIDTMPALYLYFDIMKYLAMDGTIDDAEFNAGLHASQVMADINYYNVSFKYILFPWTSSSEQSDLLKKRIDTVMAAVESKKMGLPYPADYYTGYSELMDSLNANIPAIIYTFRKYSPRVPSEKREKLSGHLKRAFNDTKDKKQREDIIALLAEFYNSQPAGRRLADDLFVFATGLDRRNENREWCALLAKQTRDALSNIIPLYPYNRNDNIIFCLRYGIPCPKLVPSNDDIVRKFQFGETLREKRESAAYLLAMDERAAFAEPSVVKVIKYIESGTIDGSGSANLHDECLTILGNIRTKKHESLEMIQKGLAHNYSNISAAASVACVKIGKASIPYIINVLYTDKKYARQNALKTLALMGKDAASASGDLRKIMKTEKDEYIRDVISDTLNTIETK